MCRWSCGSLASLVLPAPRVTLDPASTVRQWERSHCLQRPTKLHGHCREPKLFLSHPGSMTAWMCSQSKHDLIKMWR